MRTKTRTIAILALTLGASIVLVATNDGLAQRPGGRWGGMGGGGMPGGGMPWGGGKGGMPWGGGRGGMKRDPGRFFDFMSRGQNYVLIATMRDPAQAEEFAKKEGITNGKFTREQFSKYMEQRMQMFQKGGFGGGPPRRGGPDSSVFKKYDTNGDGSLNETEIKGMPSENQDFKDNWRKYDGDKNGLISLDEFNSYLSARDQATRDQKDGDRKNGDTKTAEKKDDKKDGDKKPEDQPSVTRIEIEEVENNTVVVYYKGKLPKDLPEWFTQLDTNNDGQVSLMEWLKGNKAASEFLKMDRNDDGLLTAEEVLYFNQQQNGGESANGKTQTVSATTTGSGQPSFSGPAGFGGRPGFGGQPGFGGRQFGPGGMRGFQGQGRGGFPGGFNKGNFGRKGRNRKGMNPGQ